MINNNKLILLILSISLMLSAILSAEERLDGIAATVDNRIILISEVQSQLQLALMQMKIDRSDKAAIDSLSNEILQQMIDDKLILLEAEKDTLIKITNQEIEDALNNHIARIKQQFPSEEAFLAQLSAEGLTLKELRSRYKDEVKNQLYKERLLNKRLSKVTISSGEVKEFYRTFIDSLPHLPPGVHLAHILISTEPAQSTRDSLEAFANLLYNKAISGEDFALLAKTYSDDKATAVKGGDLGQFGKGDMVPEFEKAVFNMPVGEISNVVETQFGFHIIKCTGRKDDKIRASHILIALTPSPADLELSKQKADSIYNLLLEGANFEEMAAQFSEDEPSAKAGGDLGWYASDELFNEFKVVVAEHQAGEFAAPVLSQFGYHIIKILDKKNSRPLDFEKDFSDIEGIAKRYKAQNELKKWLDQAREKYFIEEKI
ncbi:MAG: peptidylprolyl isomerase [candidate division Zixibacteria bacterium]|nr:peptidylprolyl isomerase [candidate division Zixibacteria bacterium]